MPTKRWKAEAEGITVELINSWSFSMDSSETLLVNGEVVCSEEKDKRAKFRALVTGSHRVTTWLDGVEHMIEVKVGSRWPGFFIGCHIYINGKLVGGDVGARLICT